MKYAITLGLLVFSTAATATVKFAGKFSESNPITMAGYLTEAECKTDRGDWQDGLCWFEATNDVIVDTAVQTLSVETVATNAHTCSYEAPIVRIEADSLVSQIASDEWNDATGEIETVTCEVKATYSKDGNSVAISNNGNCRSFCGARARLHIENAVRVP